MEINQNGINPKDTTALKCEECESETFNQVYFIRKASRLITGKAQDTLIPIPTFKCDSCGHINKEFTPKF